MPSRTFRKHFKTPAAGSWPATKRALKRGGQTTAAVILDWLWVVVIAAIPILQAYQLVVSPWWGWGVIGLIGLREGYTRVKAGRYIEVGGPRLAKIHSSVAGSVDDLAMTLTGSADQRLGEEACKRLVIGLLHRIKDFTSAAIHADEECRLRATLAVPLPYPPPKGGKPKSVRVWAYDETYEDCAFTDLPVNYALPGPGSPTAFVNGSIQIINDIREEAGVRDAHQRKYRSNLSVPLKAGGPKGRCVAVLNIDATEPNVFKALTVERTIVPLVAPSMNLIALVLLMRRRDAKYAFNS